MLLDRRFRVLRSAALAALAFLASAASSCQRSSPEGPPVRLVAGVSDTVVVNNFRPVKLPMQVLDAAGRTLPDSGVRYAWLSGTPTPITAAGVATCTQSGDAIVRASLGRLTTHLLLRCRPVHEVRSLRMVNLVAGGPPQELPFEAVDSAGRPVGLLAGRVTVQDSTIATVRGTRIAGRAPGYTGLDMHIGDRAGHAAVHVYQRVDDPEQVGLDQHVAVPVRLAPGEMRRWRLTAAREGYFVAVVPDSAEQATPQLAITGAACVPGLGPRSYFCLTGQDAAVIVYHPPRPRPEPERSGTLLIWRQGKL